MPKRSPSGPQFPGRSPAPDAAPPPPQVAETPPAGKSAPAPDLRTIDLKPAPAPAETAAAEARDALLRNSDPAISGPAARAAGRSAPDSDSASGNAAVSGVAPAASAAAAVPDISNRTGNLRDALDRSDASSEASAAERAVPGALQDIARPSLDDLQARAGEAAGGMPGTDGRYGMPGAETSSFGDALRAPGLNLIGGAVADLDAAIAGTAPGTGLPAGGSPGDGNEAYQGMVESALAAMTGGAGSDPFAVTSGRGAMSGSGELGLMQTALDAFSQDSVGPNVENDGGQGGIDLLKLAIAEVEAEKQTGAPDSGSGASGQTSQSSQAGQAATPGNAGAAAAPGQVPSQATNGGEAAGEEGLFTKALNWVSYKIYDRPFFGNPGNLPTVFAGNVNEAEQLAQVDDNLGKVDSNQPVGKVSQEAGVPNLETAMFKSFGTRNKKQGADAQTKPPDAKQPIDETPDNPALRAWIYEHHKDQIDAMRAGRHGWDVDPADDASDAPPAGNLSLAETAALQRGMTNFLVGNPGDPGVRGGTGGGSVSFGVLPGDRGNIDYGPDAAGQWTGSARTEDPADALSGFSGSGLSITDAHDTADAAQAGSSSASDDDSDSDDTV